MIKLKLKPRAACLNLIGMSDARQSKARDAHWHLCVQKDLPYIKITKMGKMFCVSLDMDTTTYQLSEVGLQEALAVRTTNDLMIWTRHPNFNAISAAGRSYVIVYCLTQEIALLAGGSLAIVAARRYEAKETMQIA